ncbi:hypothetical protein ALQ01_200085 [Pseudomonas savastanoi pv. glycinea]|nr:hypothetical protein ALQ01_200085 [Pseudomonas savastanoi pv. glycinea]
MCGLILKTPPVCCHATRATTFMGKIASSNKTWSNRLLSNVYKPVLGSMSWLESMGKLAFAMKASQMNILPSSYLAMRNLPILKIQFFKMISSSVES